MKVVRHSRDGTFHVEVSPRHLPDGTQVFDVKVASHKGVETLHPWFAVENCSHEQLVALAAGDFSAEVFYFLRNRGVAWAPLVQETAAAVLKTL